MSHIESFKLTFGWYRRLSLQLIREFPEEYLQERLSSRSLPVNFQFIDLGDMQLRILGMMTGKTFNVPRPTDSCISKEEIIAYVNACNDVFFEEVQKLDSNTKLNWFDRMEFNLEESLTFLLAHESVHHGEILSFFYCKNLPIPDAFKNTWGFE